jgi:uncharacterized phage protein (TIGR01671 family)
MREIKFRAYEEETKKMFYNLDYVTGSGKGAFCGRPLVRPIIMQYTGIKDRNGVEIYEGDVVKFCDFSSPLEVKFGEYQTVNGYLKYNEKHIGFFFESHKSGFMYSVFDGNEAEIVGNIYENPELLE